MTPGIAMGCVRAAGLGGIWRKWLMLKGLWVWDENDGDPIERGGVRIGVVGALSEKPASFSFGLLMLGSD